MCLFLDWFKTLNRPCIKLSKKPLNFELKIQIYRILLREQTVTHPNVQRNDAFQCKHRGGTGSGKGAILKLLTLEVNRANCKHSRLPKQ